MTEILLTGTLSQNICFGNTIRVSNTIWCKSYQLTSRDITAISQLLSAVRVSVLLML